MAQQPQVTPSVINGIASRLVGHGYLERETLQNDRRVVRFRPTEAGERTRAAHGETPGPAPPN